MGKRAPLVGDPVIAANIKRALLQANISPAEFANRLQVTRQAVNQWVSAKTTPTAKRLVQIAEQLHVPIEFLRQVPDPPFALRQLSDPPPDSELEVMEKVYQLLRNQSPPARRRILNWLSARFEE
jgi:transcriptional regulator with XRE-family HTH domain